MPTSLLSNGIQFPDGSVQTGGLPVGSILIWSSSTGTIPSGWQLCDGTNGTPNLINRFVIGASPSLIVGSTGGSADSFLIEHTHSVTSVSTTPDHFHEFTNPHTHTFSGPTATNEAGDHVHPDSTSADAFTVAGDHQHSIPGPSFPPLSDPAPAHDHPGWNSGPTPGPHTHAVPKNTGINPNAAHIHGYTATKENFAGPPDPTPIGGTSYALSYTGPGVPGFVFDTRAKFKWTPSGDHTHPITVGNSGAHTHTTGTLSPYTHNHALDPSDQLAPLTSNSHTHSTTNIIEPNGSHQHDITFEEVTLSTSSEDEHFHNLTVDSAGSSSINANLPPYYALAYIMKLS